MSAHTIEARQNSMGSDVQPDTRALLLVTTVDIGDGKKGRIEIREGDDPTTAAHQFCVIHGLPETIVEPLTMHIHEHLMRASMGNATDITEQPDPQDEQYYEEQAEQHHYWQKGAEEEDSYAQSSPGKDTYSAASSPASAKVERATTIANNNNNSYLNHHQQQQSSDHVGSMAETIRARSSAGGSGASAAQEHRQQEEFGMLANRGGVVGNHPGQQEYYYEDEIVGGDDELYQYNQTQHLQQQQQQQLQKPLQKLHRPASANSSYGAEYYGKPMPTATSGRTAAAAAAPAPDRLYADYFRKERMLQEQRRIRDLELQLQTGQIHCTPVSRALASHRNAAGYGNYGERLYVEGRLEALKKERIAAEILKEEEEAELAQLSFKPQISRMAQSLKETQSTSGITYWDRLYRKGGTSAKAQLRAEAIKREQEEDELKECKFKPETNKKSNSIMKERREAVKDMGLKLHDQLYNEALRRKDKLSVAQRRLPDDATFTPCINTSSVVLKELERARYNDNNNSSGGGGGGGGGGEHGTSSSGYQQLSLSSNKKEGERVDVAERLLQYGQKTKERVEAIRRALTAPVDPTTGREMFKPETCRAPKFARNPEGAPIGEYLYAVGEESAQRVQQQAEAARLRRLKQARSKYVNPVSEKMMDRLKKERYRAIYCYLGRCDPSTGVEPPCINLIDIVQEERFLDTIDPEVRADVEYAARLLAKSIARRLDSELDIGSVPSEYGVSSVHNVSTSPGSSSSRPGSGRSSVYSGSMAGEVGLDGFCALMEDVLDKSKGIARQYLQPLPSGRRKFEEPTFQPNLDKRSLQLAVRKRPTNVPGHEILYRTATEVAAKREERKKALEEAELKECSFKPEKISADPPPSSPNKMLRRAATAPGPSSSNKSAPGSSGLEQESIGVRGRMGSAKPTKGSAPLQESVVAEDVKTFETHKEESEVPSSYLQQHLATHHGGSSGAVVAHKPTTNTNTGTLSGVAGKDGEDVDTSHLLEDGIDAIERQIQDAMKRLNMSRERFSVATGAVSTKGAAGDKILGSPQPAAAAAAGAALAQLQASLDYQALFGSPSNVMSGAPIRSSLAVSEAQSIGARTLNVVAGTKDGVRQVNRSCQGSYADGFGSTLTGLNALDAGVPENWGGAEDIPEVELKWRDSMHDAEAYVADVIPSTQRNTTLNNSSKVISSISEDSQNPSDGESYGKHHQGGGTHREQQQRQLLQPLNVIDVRGSSSTRPPGL